MLVLYTPILLRIFLLRRKQGYDKYGYDKYSDGSDNKEEPKRPSPSLLDRRDRHRHTSPYRQQQEQRTYPAPGEYRRSLDRYPTPESDKPSSLVADTYKQDKAVLEAKEEPVDQPDAFGSSVAYPSQSYDVDDSGQDNPAKPRWV